MQMYDPDSKWSEMSAVTALDPQRLPGFEDRGEVIAINPEEFTLWKTNSLEHYENKIWALGEDEEEYRSWGAQPVGENPDLKIKAPIDLVADNPLVILLHEVSYVSYYSNTVQGD